MLPPSSGDVSQNPNGVRRPSYLWVYATDRVSGASLGGVGAPRVLRACTLEVTQTLTRLLTFGCTKKIGAPVRGKPRDLLAVAGTCEKNILRSTRRSASC